MKEISIDNIEKRYEWLLNPIKLAFEQVEQMPFLKWLSELSDTSEFAPVAKQIYFHSSTFPKAIGLMLSAIPIERGDVYKVVSEHAFEEADHHLLLLDWMVTHKILKSAEEIQELSPNLATNNCINVGYQYAIERDLNAWLSGINGAIEYCFYNFFKIASKRMRDLGAGHTYFDIHVEADQYHSVMGLQYMDEKSLTPAERERLIKKALDCISLWTTMVHSWIDISIIPQFLIVGKSQHEISVF